MIFKQQNNLDFQSAKFAWVNSNLFAITNWNKPGAKLLKLWDVRKVKEDLTNKGELTSLQIDNSKTFYIPFIDRESKLLYCIGKGEAGIMFMITVIEHLNKVLSSLLLSHQYILLC